MSHPPGVAPSRLLIALNFLSVYIIWGSTYLGIKFASESFRLFPLGALRFLAAGFSLYAWGRLAQKASRPTARHWRSAALIGIPMLFLCNGAVIWSVSPTDNGLVPRAPQMTSGVAAVVVSIVPLAVVLLEWIRPGGRRPPLGQLLGVWIGVAGMLLLKFPLGGNGRDALRVDSITVIVLIVSCFIWAVASIAARTIARPESPLVWSGMQMICAGIAHAVTAGATGEWLRVPWGALPLRDIWSMAYLIAFGSIVAFTSFSWLLRVTSTASVSTYAFVNPVVALILGAAFAAEKFKLQTLVASLVIISAVALITLAGRNGKKAV